MFDKLKTILSRTAVDYADIRYEIKNEVKIVFKGKELVQVSSNSTDGYVLRILKDGGLSSVSVTKETDIEKAIKTAGENSTLIAGNLARPVSFAKSETAKETFTPELKEDPRQIPLDEKLALVRKYNNIALQQEKILTTNISYLEVTREKYFVNTEGNEIKEELITTKINGLIIGKDGSLIQSVRVGVGGSNGFAVLRNREEEFEKRSSLVLQLLDAEPVKAGEYDVILNQNLAGVFTHEAFGHFSEADLIEDNPSMRKKMKLGARLGNDALNIIDDPTIPEQLGFYRYDDEGVRAKPTQLMKNGVLVGRLHSRRTAAAFDEPLNGHCVAEDYRYPPIIRMGTIFIQPGDVKFEELLDELGNGLYILDSRGGQTSGENFTFGAQYGFIVKNGKLNKMVRDINISGNLYTTLKNIKKIADDLKLSETGGCGKGQINIRYCHGAPHILIQNVIIGGV